MTLYNGGGGGTRDAIYLHGFPYVQYILQFYVYVVVEGRSTITATMGGAHRSICLQCFRHEEDICICIYIQTPIYILLLCGASTGVRILRVWHPTYCLKNQSPFFCREQDYFLVHICMLHHGVSQANIQNHCDQPFCHTRSCIFFTAWSNPGGALEEYWGILEESWRNPGGILEESWGIHRNPQESRGIHRTP